MDYKDKLITKHIECVIYGEEKFDEIKFRYVRNSDYRNKPTEGGLWASPVNSQYGWKEWCLDEQFNIDELNKKFEVDFIGSVYLIDKYEDLVCIPFIGTGYNKIPDFERMFNDGVDAIHLTVDGERETRFSNPDLYGWDFETVLIMNPRSIYTKGVVL